MVLVWPFSFNWPSVCSGLTPVPANGAWTLFLMTRSGLPLVPPFCLPLVWPIYRSWPGFMTTTDLTLASLRSPYLLLCLLLFSRWPVYRLLPDSMLADCTLASLRSPYLFLCLLLFSLWPVYSLLPDSMLADCALASLRSLGLALCILTLLCVPSTPGTWPSVDPIFTLVVPEISGQVRTNVLIIRRKHTNQLFSDD